MRWLSWSPCDSRYIAHLDILYSIFCPQSSSYTDLLFSSSLLVPFTPNLRETMLILLISPTTSIAPHSKLQSPSPFVRPTSPVTTRVKGHELECMHGNSFWNSFIHTDIVMVLEQQHLHFPSRTEGNCTFALHMRTVPERFQAASVKG